jgi:hypothetical protein
MLYRRQNWGNLQDLEGLYSLDCRPLSLVYHFQAVVFRQL